MTGDETGIASQLKSTPSIITHPAYKRLWLHHQPIYVPYSLLTAVRVLLCVLEESKQWKSCEIGPMVFLLYPRRLEYLNICRCPGSWSNWANLARLTHCSTWCHLLYIRLFESFQTILFAFPKLRNFNVKALWLKKQDFLKDLQKKWRTLL